MKRKPIDRPISFLPMFAKALHGDLSTAEEQYETLYAAKDKPSVLTDDIIERIIRLHEEKNEFIANYTRQFKLWRKEKLTTEQRREIQRLERKLPRLKEVNEKVLKLAHQMQPYTIDKILAMDPGELAIKHLLGEIETPALSFMEKKQRFLVITDQSCEGEDRQLTFFLKEQGTDAEVKDLLEVFLKGIKERYGYFDGWGAKRIMGFFKNFAEFEGIDYVVGAMDFNKVTLKMEVLEKGMTSFVRLWCDKYDERGYFLSEIVAVNEPEFLPTLIVNKLFMAEFIHAAPPCFGLGLMEEEGQEIGFLAMRPDQTIPQEVTAGGFNLGHSLVGTSEYVLIQFVFEFYDFGRYYTLINPNNPLVQKVLSTMVESGDYFFLAINPDNSVTTFRASARQGDLAGLTANFPKIQRATTTDEQYRSGLAAFSKKPSPSGTLMNWVCRDNMDYLDLRVHRFELKPV